MNDTAPLCIHCIHAKNLMPDYKPTSATTFYCEHPKAIVTSEISLVTGEATVNYSSCWNARRNENMCGAVGKWFDPTPIEAGKRQSQAVP